MTVIHCKIYLSYLRFCTIPEMGDHLEIQFFLGFTNLTKQSKVIKQNSDYLVRW